MIKRFFIFFVLIQYSAFAEVPLTNNIVNGCDSTSLHTVNNKSKLIPVFEPIEYNCNSGYFLPANTLGCQPCPNGHTCPGGTFSFNETIAQGINKKTSFNQTTSNICSTNILHSVNNKVKLIPVFEPNVINLNWYDRDTIVAQTTCTYGEKITLPPAPTRPGYIFSGWRLRTTPAE